MLLTYGNRVTSLLRNAMTARLRSVCNWGISSRFTGRTILFTRSDGSTLAVCMTDAEFDALLARMLEFKHSLSGPPGTVRVHDVDAALVGPAQEEV